MNWKSSLLAAAALSSLVLIGCASSSETNAPQPPPPVPTQADQSNDPADLKVTQDIRQALASSEYSAGARNATVVTTADHVVHISGSVVSPSERRHVLALAKSYAGKRHVQIYLKVN